MNSVQETQGLVCVFGGATWPPLRGPQTQCGGGSSQDKGGCAINCHHHLGGGVSRRCFWVMGVTPRWMNTSLVTPRSGGNWVTGHA